jgi:hypothetical protein
MPVRAGMRGVRASGGLQAAEASEEQVGAMTGTTTMNLETGTMNIETWTMNIETGTMNIAVKAAAAAAGAGAATTRPSCRTRKGKR